jgi:hypothetical protein
MMFRKKPKPSDAMKNLEARVAMLERANRIGVGEFDHTRILSWFGWGEIPSGYPHEVSLKEAVQKVMNHCGITLEYTPPVDGTVQVKQEKPQKKKQ